jgi:putative acetyltransferase
MMQIKPGNLDDARVIALLNTHIGRARAETARGSAHALDHDALRSPDISFWTLWAGDKLLSVGALKRLAPDHCEVKSMYTAESARRTGAGTALLRHLIQTAKSFGATRLSLETGSWSYFAPARSFYAHHGFIHCAPFGDYVADRNSVFMTLDLENQ